jgi:hypothetical protein
MVLRLHPQLLNNAFTILKAPLTLHVPQRIPLDLLIRRLLLQYIDQNLIAGVGAYGVNDREAEFALCEVFAKPFEGRVARCGREIEVVV